MVFIFSIVLLTAAKNTVAVSLSDQIYGRISSYNHSYFEKLNALLKGIKSEEDFENLIVIETKENKTIHCPLADFNSAEEFPSVIIDQNFSEEYQYTNNFPNLAISLICTNNVDNAIKIFQSTFFSDLNLLRHIVYMKSTNINYLEKNCNLFFEIDVYNVLIILEDFDATLTYYKCRKYPPSNQSFQRGFLNKTARIFENQFLNMYGDTIRTLPDQMPPRSMAYRNKNGELKMLGYFGKLIQTFAERRNATLAFPIAVNIGKVIDYNLLRQYVDKNILDLATGSNTSPLQTVHKGLSYPFEVFAYCFMIPLPQHIPLYKVYFVILQPLIVIVILLLVVIYGALFLRALKKSGSDFSVLDVLVNDKSIRGMLGQPYSIPSNLNLKTKFICFQIGYGSLLINTMYQAYLQSYFTEPPRQGLVRNLDDVAAAGLKIPIDTPDASYLETYHPAVLYRHPEVVIRINNTNEFNAFRDTFNTQFIYPVTTARWQTYQQQQAHFQHQMFFFSEEFCIFKYHFFRIPLRVSLPYRDIFNDFILKVWATGLFQLWQSQNFFDMVKLNMSSFDDLSFDNFNKQFRMKNLKWIAFMYCSCVITSVLTLIGELVFSSLVQNYDIGVKITFRRCLNNN